MTRFNAVATLVAVSTERDKYGATHEVEARREVYCNRYTLGYSSLVEAQAQGLQAKAQIQLRAVDYQGEPRVIFEGTEYEVSSTTGSGELVRLTLARKLRNV